MDLQIYNKFSFQQKKYPNNKCILKYLCIFVRKTKY